MTLLNKTIIVSKMRNYAAQAESMLFSCGSVQWNEWPSDFNLWTLGNCTNLPRTCVGNESNISAKAELFIAFLGHIQQNAM